MFMTKEDTSSEKLSFCPLACRPAGGGGAALPAVVTQVTQDAEGRLMPSKGPGGFNHAAAAAAGGWNPGKDAADPEDGGGRMGQVLLDMQGSGGLEGNSYCSLASLLWPLRTTWSTKPWF